MLLAGLGAEVIKLEPRDGSPSRQIGPFASDTHDPEQSIFFWRYNLNKKSAVLDVDAADSEARLAALASKADIVLLSGEYETVERRLGLWRELAEANPRLIVCTITPFGLDGPYRALKATDLVQMAMGGIMAVCGYDPDQDGAYDTPPIAPAMWHSYHLGGEYAAVAMMAAINFRELTGEGQFIDVSVHEAVNTCTEVAIPTYIYAGQVVKRQTARHAAPSITHARLSKSADGIFMLASLSPFEREMRALAQLADQVGIAHVLGTPEFAQLEKDDHVAAAIYRQDLLEQLVESLPADELFHRAQSHGPRMVTDPAARAESRRSAFRRAQQLRNDSSSGAGPRFEVSRHGRERRSGAAFFLHPPRPPPRRAYRGSAEARVIKLTDNGFPASGKIDRKFAGTDEPRTRLTIQIGKGANIFPRAARDAPTQR